MVVWMSTSTPLSSRGAQSASSWNFGASLTPVGVAGEAEAGIDGLAGAPCRHDGGCRNATAAFVTFNAKAAEFLRAVENVGCGAGGDRIGHGPNGEGEKDGRQKGSQRASTPGGENGRGLYPRVLKRDGPLEGRHSAFPKRR